MSTPHTFLPRVTLFACLSLCVLLYAVGCGSGGVISTLSVLRATPLVTSGLTGDFEPVRDPSIVLRNGTYYLFSTDTMDTGARQFLPVRCSSDKIQWRACGQVFTKIPSWVSGAVPGVGALWAPDISFFGGMYHLYYSASMLGSQTSVIGLTTNKTLDPADPDYAWIDAGQVIGSSPKDDFNAIDPNILVDTDKRVWLTYGSFWSGIKQREINPATGMFLQSNAVRYELAARPGTWDGAVEGASLVHHESSYFLFLSVDHCCASSTAKDNYKQIVGRSASPNGPFLDAEGAALMHGGGSILLQGSGTWAAPGGGTVYLNPQSDDSMIVFHALDLDNHARPALWTKVIAWKDNWPVLN